MEVAKALLKNCKDERLVSAFENVKFIKSLKQPFNLLASFSHSQFKRGKKDVGIYRWSDKWCKICKIYLQIGTKVALANGFIWEIKCFADCNSLNVFYFLICECCTTESYIGKTDDFWDQMNNHMSGVRHAKSSNHFDNHVIKCAEDNRISIKEPFFKVHILMVCSSYYKLLGSERNLHNRGFVTMNNKSNENIIPRIT